MQYSFTVLVEHLMLNAYVQLYIEISGIDLPFLKLNTG
jgi:hypothetical protein